ncbi:UDP-3-O-acyl-N-acetylglucosamine deacetylase [Alphaproteobacteria bacterium]|nr:UDP-3-O-acyl-N-acetylglucosamine deacetylase [Alphaproteobacteria bacterium]
MNFINNSNRSNIVKQTTLKNKIYFSGVGIHNGKAVSMSIEPGETNTGIIFERTDVKGNNLIKAIIDNIDTTCLCTKIKNKSGISVSTIEHLMATFNGLEIDNVKVKINAPELPALDGSSHDYTKKILSTGIKVQSYDRKYIRILKKIKVTDNNRYISIEPSKNLSLKIAIDYPNTIIGNSELIYNHSQNNFVKDLSKARTFTLIEDVEKMRVAGYAMGGNINNAIVVDKYNIINPNGLRVDKEFVKHKALDCIGDFYLLGMPLIGLVKTLAPGHKLNQMFIKKVLSNKNNYSVESLNRLDHPRQFINELSNNHHSKNIINVA